YAYFQQFGPFKDVLVSVSKGARNTKKKVGIVVGRSLYAPLLFFRWGKGDNTIQVVFAAHVGYGRGHKLNVDEPKHAQIGQVVQGLVVINAAIFAPLLKVDGPYEYVGAVLKLLVYKVVFAYRKSIQFHLAFKLLNGVIGVYKNVVDVV